MPRACKTPSSSLPSLRAAGVLATAVDAVTAVLMCAHPICRLLLSTPPPLPTPRILLRSIAIVFDEDDRKENNQVLAVLLDPKADVLTRGGCVTLSQCHCVWGAPMAIIAVHCCPAH